MRILVLALLLAGCASSGPKVVRVPVPVTCVQGEIPPEPPTVADRLDGNAEHDIGIIAASALRLRAWGRELSAIVKGCQG